MGLSEFLSKKEAINKLKDEWMGKRVTNEELKFQLTAWITRINERIGKSLKQARIMPKQAHEQRPHTKVIGEEGRGANLRNDSLLRSLQFEVSMV
jgi:hypothetical protein